jgi:hypothetical protein
MVVQGGGGGMMLQDDKYILGNYGIKDAKGHFFGWNMKLVMWGRQDMMAPFHILHYNHRPYLQPLMLGMFHIPTQGTCDYKSMGPKN